MKMNGEALLRCTGRSLKRGEVQLRGVVVLLTGWERFSWSWWCSWLVSAGRRGGRIAEGGVASLSFVIFAFSLRLPLLQPSGGQHLLKMVVMYWSKIIFFNS